jgi:anti-sigma factor RsiW
MNRSNFEEPHPTEAQLVLALDGELEQPAVAEIERHMERCAVCRAEYERSKQMSEQIARYHQGTLQSQVRPEREQQPAASARGWQPKPNARSSLFHPRRRAGCLVCLSQALILRSSRASAERTNSGCSTSPRHNPPAVRCAKANLLKWRWMIHRVLRAAVLRWRAAAH